MTTELDGPYRIKPQDVSTPKKNNKKERGKKDADPYPAKLSCSTTILWRNLSRYNLCRNYPNFWEKENKDGITKTFHLLLFTTKRAFQNPQLSLIHYTPKQPIPFYITAGERGIGGKSHQMFVWQIFGSKMVGDKKAEKARNNINQIGPEEVPKSLAKHYVEN